MTNEKGLELKELENIKKLLVLQLVRDGATSIDTGHALGITEGRVRQMFPISKLKKKEKGEKNE